MLSGNRLSPFATPSATREVLERHGLFTKYALGQNFLVNDDVVRKIVNLAELCEGDEVLEVGPGIGTLTAALLRCGARVIAVEKDRDLPAVLADTLSPWAECFTLLQKDALELREDDFAPDAPLPAKLVSNLPYAVAATVVLDYFQRFDFLESATVMVQKEVADRMMARPGTKAYGAYTVKLGLHARACARFPVAPGNFFPPPHVESAVIRLDRFHPTDPGTDGAPHDARNAPLAISGSDADGAPLSPAQVQAACRMADAAFATRRKTLANSCKTFYANAPHIQEALPHIFEAAAVDPRRRGETLTQAEFVRLGNALLTEAADPLR